MKPGLFNLPDLRQGDTYDSFIIVNGLRYSDGTPIPCSQARLQVRDLFDKLVLEFNLSVSGQNQNIVTLNRLDPSVTSTLPSGTFTYDLEVTLVSSEVWTILEGTLKIESDITK